MNFYSINSPDSPVAPISKSGQKRIPMPAGTLIPVTGTDLRITRDGSEHEYFCGSTCLVYYGHIASGTGVVAGMHVIIKEFYPLSPGIPAGGRRNHDGSLHVPADVQRSSEYANLREQFLQGLEYQKELAGSNAMEISIRPLFVSKWGDSLYVISDAHMGTCPETRVFPSSLRETLSFAVSFSEAMGILHENGYIMTDIKAENFLWIPKPCSVRIIDTDSLLPYRNPERFASKPLFTNGNHMSPELEFLQLKMQEGCSGSELSLLKKVMLTPNADRYAMGIFLFELIFRQLPGFSDYAGTVGKYRETGADFETELTAKLTTLYGSELSDSGVRGQDLSHELLAVFQKTLIRNPGERRKNGYPDDGALVADLQAAYAKLSSEKLVLRREAAGANARFAAYNLLQKYPLFDFKYSACRPGGFPFTGDSDIQCFEQKASCGEVSGNTVSEKNVPENNAAGLNGPGNVAPSRKASEENAPVEELRVAIIGRHAMRADMLSAVLSIGQMPDNPLCIELVSEDADTFWEEYISEKNNPALGRAVTWEHAGVRWKPANNNLMKRDDTCRPDAADHFSDGRFQSAGLSLAAAPLPSGTSAASPEEYDRSLVDRPLAHLILCTRNYQPTANYIILLEEDSQKRETWIRRIAGRAASLGRKTLISHLHFENDAPPVLSPELTTPQPSELSGKDVGKQGISEDKEEGFVTLCPISAESFTEEYSEKMFSEKIYRMGFMAHAYYCKVMDEDPEKETDADLNVLEKQFRGDLYSVASAERCALHGIYKLAAVGINRKRPGRFLRYYRKIEDPDILEELAWIEHLSWTAHLLTSGAVPVSMEEFDGFAYRDANDWKDKTDSRHLRHPLLAASARNPRQTLQGLRKTKDVTPEIYGSLDPLDRVSVQIARWYAAHRSRYRKMYLEWIQKLEGLCVSGGRSSRQPFSCSKDVTARISVLRQSGLACIGKMGEALIRQDPFYRQAWEFAAGQIAALFPHREDIGQLLSEGRTAIMKPVFDALEDRDFKQYDRDLARAVIDIIS